VLLQLDAVSKSYAHFGLGPISLGIEPGTVLGFAGPNGAGKTTTLNIIMGIVRPDAGRVSILDKPVSRKEGAWKQDVGYIGDNQYFYERWSGYRNLELHARLRPEWCMDRAEAIAGRLDLDLEKPAAELSRGNRMKLALICGLAYNPSLLVLDEPTSGLDPVTRSEVLDLLLEYASTGERSVLFSTHIIPDIARVADRVTFIRNGKLIRTDSPANITETWRKIRFSYAFSEIELPGLVSHRVDGQTHLVVTNQQEQVVKILEKSGALIRDITPISLEEAAVFILKREEGMSCSN